MSAAPALLFAYSLEERRLQREKRLGELEKRSAMLKDKEGNTPLSWEQFQNNSSLQAGSMIKDILVGALQGAALAIGLAGLAAITATPLALGGFLQLTAACSLVVGGLAAYVSVEDGQPSRVLEQYSDYIGKFESGLGQARTIEPLLSSAEINPPKWARSQSHEIVGRSR